MGHIWAIYTIAAIAKHSPEVPVLGASSNT